MADGDEAALAERAAELMQRYDGLQGSALLRPLIACEFGHRIALVSSFGTESAVLLALIAEIDRHLPVIFIDTGKHFGETRRYRERLVDLLGLTTVRIARPASDDLAARDPSGALWSTDANACCHVRKVRPLERALEGFDAWISGRKHYQGTMRRHLPIIEAAAGRIKINPVAGWTPGRIEAEFAARELPRHPLEADGYLSIGCMPCTARTMSDDDARSGRWAGSDKTECGIHLPWPAHPGRATA